VCAGACTTPDLQQRLQSTLGDSYQLDRELGRGGMSRVFIAHEKTLGRDVVVKVLPPEMAAEVSVERFQREIQLAAKLQHPHIVPVLAAGESGGLPYLVMPYIAGETLRERLAREGELPVAVGIRLLRDVAVALDYAHRNGIVHRDIKPENVLLTGGSAVVADFGVAKALAVAVTSDGAGAGETARTLTSIGVALGTPMYMAPEQAAADPATDHRADIYAWGVLAYEVMVGLPPFTGRSPQALFAAHMTERPKPIDEVRPACPPALAEVVMRSLEKRPADRPQSAAEIVRVLDDLAANVTSGPTVVRPAARQRFRPMWLYAAAAILVVVLVSAALIARRSASPAAGDSIRSIAVLPFVDAAGAGGDDDYFVEGMSDELSAALGRVPGLQVASRTSTYAFKGETVDVRQVGNRLRVDAVLEGRVRRAGDRLRVTAQLTSVATGLSFWADSYERQVKDVFAVQDEIARAIASALQLRLGGTGAAARQGQGTADLAAYDLYLRGRFYWHRRGGANLDTAARYFRQAIERDPNFARAHAGLAIAQVLIPEYTDAVNEAEYNARAEASAARALELDSTLAEAYAARGLARVHAWDWQGGEAAYRRAVHFEPNYATAHQWYGELLYHLGRTRESVAEMRRATELDPLAPIAAVAHSYSLRTDRQALPALQEAERAISLAPDMGIAHHAVAMSALLGQQYDRAVAAARRAVELEPRLDSRLATLVLVLGKSGRREEALAAFRSLQSRASDRPVAMMWGYIGIGEPARAAGELERAVARRDQSLTYSSIAADPAFDDIRGLPSYNRAVRGMGLPVPAGR
jgi:eukaryotic-like serine/threonine-protein kinase